MHEVPPAPGRGNWIWLGSAALTIAAVTGGTLGLGLLSAGGCHPRPAGTERPAGTSATSRAAAAGKARAASPPPSVTGHAYFYDPGAASGSCSLGPFPAGGRYAALPPQQYAHGAACGTYLEVRGPRGSVRVEAVDLCPTCAATTVNLSRAAYDRVGDPSPGISPVTYRRVPDPALPGPLELRVAASGLPGVPAIQVRNHGNPLASVSLAAPGAGPAAARDWRSLTLNRNDYWLPGRTAGRGPVAVRITDTRGHQVLLPRVMLVPGTLVRTTSWMYRLPPAGAPAGRAGGQPGPAAATPARSTRAATASPGC
jgi:expansin (peptidoglycan-binding protein)